MATRKIISTIVLNILSATAFQQSITLNDTILGAPGINVDIINNTWHINPTSQYGADIKIAMTNEWGFHPLVPSTITFIVDGYTPNITRTDGELLILFGVENKYFSVVIRLEVGSAWKSYPDYKYSELATTNDIFSDLIIPPSTESRWNRISNNDQWTNIGHPNLYKIALKWPLKISITNNPIENRLHYRCILPNRTLYVDFNDSFATNAGLNTYFMNDASDGKPFDIYSIQVTYDYTTPTPSMSPTISPTISPINYPTTRDPTLYPTTPAPILSIHDATVNPTVSNEQIDILTTIELKHENVSKIHRDSNMIYVAIIVILSVLLCIVTFILIKKQYDGCMKPSENEKVRNKLAPDYIKNQLVSGSCSKIGGDDQKDDVSDSDDELYDSDEEIYAQNDTPYGTETDTLKRINSEGIEETHHVQVIAISI